MDFSSSSESQILMVLLETCFLLFETRKLYTGRHKIAHFITHSRETFELRLAIYNYKKDRKWFDTGNIIVTERKMTGKATHSRNKRNTWHKGKQNLCTTERLDWTRKSQVINLLEPHRWRLPCCRGGAYGLRGSSTFQFLGIQRRGDYKSPSLAIRTWLTVVLKSPGTSFWACVRWVFWRYHYLWAFFLRVDTRAPGIKSEWCTYGICGTAVCRWCSPAESHCRWSTEKPGCPRRHLSASRAHGQHEEDWDPRIP